MVLNFLKILMFPFVFNKLVLLANYPIFIFLYILIRNHS